MQRDQLLVSEMIEAADRAHQLTADITLEQLRADRLRAESLLWNFTVLGEAATQLSDELKAKFPNVPWQQPARLRNRIVHGYWSIDLEILHTTATDQLPAFATQLRNVLGTLNTDPQDGVNV
ncbi:MAG: DUF86 domain-containing protein [Nocardiopsaceae bacterium]|jgi:uncharacterized protein with HEPN domain|nr:DUF86 domain-containing protein [Nocardiopsaceae bacterium]